MTATSAGYLASKPRYEISRRTSRRGGADRGGLPPLRDLLRGQASQILNHGYLAVDFFFMLSGFVIGYAYDDRWNRMSLKDFFKRRLIRLHPMVVMGSVIGALFFYFQAAAFPMIADVAWWKVLLICLLACTILPRLSGMGHPGWGETSPLNGPAWSLLYEYIANILYALVIRRFSKLLLGFFVAAAAVLTLDLTLNLNLFGLLSADRSRGMDRHRRMERHSGADLHRLLAPAVPPFFAGLLLSRLGGADPGAGADSGGVRCSLRRRWSCPMSAIPRHRGSTAFIRRW